MSYRSEELISTATHCTELSLTPAGSLSLAWTPDREPRSAAYLFHNWCRRSAFLGFRWMSAVPVRAGQGAHSGPKGRRRLGATRRSSARGPAVLGALPGSRWLGPNPAMQSVLRHVQGLPLQAPWTGQPGRTAGRERLGFRGDTRATPRAAGGPDAAPPRRWTCGPADGRLGSDTGPRYELDRLLRCCTAGPTRLIHVDGHRGPTALKPTAGVNLTAVRLGTGLGRPDSADRTRQTGAYIPLDRTTRTAKSAWTC